MSQFKDHLCFLGYKLSYQLFSLYYSAKNLMNSLRPKDNSPEIIKISHIYFRPTSSFRSNSSYDTKELVWEIDHLHDIRKIWDIVQEHLKKKNNKLMTGDTVEIHYTVPFRDQSQNKFEKSYIVPYSYPVRINFPPYDLKTIREYYHSSVYKPGVLSADVGERDITNEVERWVGPLDNFYDDKDIRQGMYVTRNLVVGDGPDPLIVMNKEGDEFIFNDRDRLTWSHEQAPSLSL